LPITWKPNIAPGKLYTQFLMKKVSGGAYLMGLQAKKKTLGSIFAGITL
jgi:hypothetical protein